MGAKTRYEIEFLYRPGNWMQDEALAELVRELRAVAASCFDELPDYQVMRGTREELSDKVIAVARQQDGELVGFCSAVLLPVEGVGTVMHLGLTCVSPTARGSRLTHILTSKVVMGYILRYRPVGRLWISSCACVLSSLGNTALYFDDIYPSPFEDNIPTEKHHKIAAAIDRNYRDKMYILDSARFDPLAFVFRGSVRETVFQKKAEDRRYHHRKASLNSYYSSIMDFDNGDEVLQVGHVSLLTGLSYQLRKRKHRQLLNGLDPVTEPA